MALDLLDKKIIYELDLDVRQSSSQIAKKLKTAKETVNFRIKRLLKNKIIKGFYAIIDNSKINLFFYKILIKFKEISPKQRELILNNFTSYPNMAQVMLFEGKYDVQLFFLAKDNNEVMNLMKYINSLCGDKIEKKEILIINLMHRFNLKFLYSKGKITKEIVEGKISNYKIDKIGWKVLQEISKNARISILKIAINLKISSQLAHYHLKKLIKEKIILGTHVSINYDKLKMQHYHLAFQVNDHNTLPKIIEFFNHTKKSIFATQMIGNYDGSVELIVKNNEELRIFLDELRTLFADKINILDVMMIYKEYSLRLYPI